MTYPTISPELTLDFAKSEQLDPRITFTRSSTGTYLYSDGLIKTAPSGVARFDYDSSGNALGLLVEESRTNLIQRSSDYTTYWNKYKVTIDPNVETAPDGTTTASKMQWSGSGGRNMVFVQPATDVTQTHTCSFYAKADEWNYAAVAIQPPGGGQPRYWITVDLTTGAIEEYTQSTASQTSAIATPLPNGWWRVSATANVNSAGKTTVQMEVGMSPNNTFGSSVSGTPDGTSGIYIWGAQEEQGSFLTSYIPTSGSTVTRAADLATMPTAGIYGDDFTTINKDFGTVGGSDTLTIVGPNAERTVVYPEHLTQAQINEVATSDDDGYWRWRVLGSSFALPNFNTNGQVTVDWGDGTVEVLTTAEHTFTNGGGYHEIGFRLDSGTFFNTRILNNSTHKSKVRSVGPAPSSMSANLEHGFFGCNKLKVYDATTSVTSNLNNAFKDCTELLSFPFTNTSNVTGWQSTWAGCSSLTSFPSIDTPSGGSFYYTWKNCSSLTSFPLVNTSSKSSIQGAWYGCSGLTSFPLIDTSSTTNVSYAWQNCSSLTSFPLIDTSSTTNFAGSWAGCTGLTSFPLIDTSSGTAFNSTWSGCSNLTSFPLIDTSSGTNFAQTWRNCSGLTSFPLIDTSSVTNIDRAWVGCSGLTSFPLIDTSSVTALKNAWKDCSGLTSFPLIDTANATGNCSDAWINCSSLTSFPAIVCNGSTYNEAWKNCTNLANFPANMFDSTPITVGKGHGQSWNGAWQNCALTAQSIENILVSLDTNGAQNCQVGIQGGSNAGQSTWTTAATTAYNNLITKGWTIDSNP